MRCSQCWVENDEGARKCASCGHKLQKVPINGAPRRDRIADYFAFRKLVTPYLIKEFYKLGVFIISLLSIIAVIAPHLIERTGYQGTSAAMVTIGAIIFFILGNLIWRMICESAILIFSLHEVIVSLDDKARTFVDAREQL